jgi:GNAT superfamily N-acetyltransferase
MVDLGSIRIQAVSDLSALEVKAFEDWFREDFPPNQFEWDRPSWYLTVNDQSGSIGRVGILARQILVGGAPIRVGGINGVATRPHWRHRGVASFAMRSAAEFMATRLGLEHALLLCSPKVSPLYAKLGWKPVAEPVSFAQRSGSAVYPGMTMVLEMGKAAFPIGPIDMCGLPW